MSRPDPDLVGLARDEEGLRVRTPLPLFFAMAASGAAMLSLILAFALCIRGRASVTGVSPVGVRVFFLLFLASVVTSEVLSLAGALVLWKYLRLRRRERAEAVVRKVMES